MVQDHGFARVGTMQVQAIMLPLIERFENLGLTKKPLSRVSKPVPGAHGKRGLERGWQNRLAKGWRRVGEGLAKGWQRVGKGLADLLAPPPISEFQAPV